MVPFRTTNTRTTHTCRTTDHRPQTAALTLQDRDYRKKQQAHQSTTRTLLFLPAVTGERRAPVQARTEMPPPHAQSHAHQPVAVSQSAAGATSMSLPASAYNLHLNSIALASSSNLSVTSASYSAASNPTSRSTTPASQSTVSRKPLYSTDQHQPQRPVYDTSVPLSRTVYGGSSSLHPHANKASHIANSAPHISSALNYPANFQTQAQTTFFPASLPRTSSLLPPPRITVSDNAWKQPALHDPFHASSWADPENDRDHDDTVSPKNTRRRGSKTHSRSSSLGGLSDGFRNLNRWSISTASSRASNATPGTRNRFSRRMSIDSTSLFTQNNQQPTSPRRLQKGRPSTAGASPEERKSSIPPLATLPPILPLPSLEQEDFGRAAFSRQQSRQESRTESNVSRLGNGTPGVNETSFLSISARDRPDSVLPRSSFSRDATMAHPENGSPTFVRGHQRSRSQGLKSSTDSATSPRTRAKQPSQKAMLSKALQKANTAVQLDNAQNFEGARTAYYEACDLLQQVLDRTPGDEDKKKLEAIVSSFQAKSMYLIR